MAYRRFTDDGGRQWEAWEVHPTAVERRINDERRANTRPEPDRRQQRNDRFNLPGHLRGGWLAFQASSEHRRLAPIPRGWWRLPDAELGALLDRAARRPVPPFAPSDEDSRQ